jgi:hypothetical protein
MRGRLRYTDPSTKTRHTVVREKGWARSDDAAPIGGVLATLVERAAGPTGSHVEIVPPESAPANQKSAKKPTKKPTKKSAKKPAKKSAKKPAKKRAK